jgi:hypothetical protein
MMIKVGIAKITPRRKIIIVAFVINKFRVSSFEVYSLSFPSLPRNTSLHAWTYNSTPSKSRRGIRTVHIRQVPFLTMYTYLPSDLTIPLLPNEGN